MANNMEKTNAEEKASVLDILLGGTLPNMQKELPTAEYKIDRLSEFFGKDVIFKLQALPYGKVKDLQRLTQESDIQIILAGVVSPNLKDERLLEKVGGATPADAVKNLLLAGEIDDLQTAIEKLSGYRHKTITEVKNG